jgi:hypothetical protein
MATVCPPNPSTSTAIGLMESQGDWVLNSYKFQKQILLSYFLFFSFFFHKFYQGLSTSFEHQNISCFVTKLYDLKTSPSVIRMT